MEIEKFRKRIISSLCVEKFKFSKLENLKEDESKDINYNIEKIFLLEIHEIKSISLKLSKSGKIKEALIFANEIEDAEYLWLEHYPEMINLIIDYSRIFFDISLDEKIILIAEQFSELEKYVEYSKSKDEIIAQNAKEISIAYIEMSEKFIDDLDKHNIFINKAIKILEYCEKIEWGVDPLECYYQVFLKLTDRGLKEKCSIVYEKIVNILNTIPQKNIWDYQFYLINTLYLRKDQELDLFFDFTMDISDFGLELQATPQWDLNKILLLDDDNKKIISSHTSSLFNSMDINYLNGSVFSEKNSGQFGATPYLTIDTVAAAVKSNILNVIFYKFCQIGEDFNAKEIISKSIELANSIVNQTIRSRSYQLISSVYADVACLADKEINYLERAFYWASAVNDVGECRCDCTKYTKIRYKGIVCDRCNTLVTNEGYQGASFEYIFDKLKKKKGNFEINQVILNLLDKNGENKHQELKLKTFLLETLLDSSYLKVFRRSIHENMILREKHSSVYNYLNELELNLDTWADVNLLQNGENWYEHRLGDPDFRQGEPLSIEDEEDWEEISIINNMLNKKHVWDETPPSLRYWDIDSKDNKPEKDFKENLEFYFSTESINEVKELRFSLGEKIYENKEIHDSIYRYINDEDFTKTTNLTTKILLDLFLKLINNYYKKKNIKDIETCLKDFKSLSKIITDHNEVSNYYYRLVDIIIKNQDTSKYKIANNISSKSEIILFANSFLEKNSFIDSLKIYKQFNQFIIKSLSYSLIKSKINELNIDNNKFIYLSNFNNYPKSLLNYLNYQLNLISPNEKNKIQLIEQVIDIPISSEI